MTRQEIHEKALKVWGEDSQIYMAAEECAELIQALMQSFRLRGQSLEHLDKIREEVADVCIMVEQMKLLFGPKAIEKKVDQKFKKVEALLAAEERQRRGSNKEESAFQVDPVVDYEVRSLCSKPYPGHPNGCPNFGRRGCPPDAKLFDQYFDLNQPVYAVVNEFDLAAHVDRMRAKHPDWSQRQLVCCRYWQTRARKQLRAKIDRAFQALHFPKDSSGYVIVNCPEAMGVNVTETLMTEGIILEWPPKKIARQVALIAKVRRAEMRSRAGGSSPGP